MPYMATLYNIFILNENKIINMNIFDKAFGRERTPNIRKRTLANLFKDGGFPEYIIYYREAINSYNSQNYHWALINIDEAIEKSDIDDWKHFAFKANILEYFEQYNQAIDNYIKAIDFAQDDIRVYALYHQIGFCCLNLGDNNKAIEFYSYAIDLKKKHPNSSFNEDLEGIDNGVLLGVEFKKLYNNRACALKNIGKLQNAFEDCIRSLEYDENYSNPYLLLYQIFSLDGQKGKAIDFLKKICGFGKSKCTKDA